MTMNNLVASPWDPAAFVANAFSNRFGKTGTPLKGWGSYCTELNSYLTFVRVKSKLPLIIHGTFRPGGRDQDHMAAVSALAVDHDSPVGKRPVELLKHLKDSNISYVYQERVTPNGASGPANETVKYHLVLPFSDPPTFAEGSRDGYGINYGRMARMRQYLEALLDVSLDKAMDRPTQGLYPYCVRDGVEPYQEHHVGVRALDLGATLQKLGYKDRAHYGKQTLVTHGGAAIWDTLQDLRINEAPGQKGLYIHCPAGHGDATKTKTLLTPTGRVICMAEKCRGKPTEYFIDLLEKRRREALEQNYLARYRAEAAEYDLKPKIDLHQVADTIARELRDVNPHEPGIRVLRITPGAGKTWGAVRYLEQYCAPLEEEAGRTAVVAFPTNALLREVSAGIQIPHRIRGGVLSVLNENGTHACQKYDLAKRVQEAGGNVHRVLCARCEFSDGCSARNGTDREVRPYAEDEGRPSTLTLTNHALLPTVLRELREKRGRTPLVVLDESPGWVETVEVRLDELRTVGERLRRDLAGETGRDTFSDLRLYPDRLTSLLLEAVSFAESMFLNRDPGPEGVDVDVDAALRRWSVFPARKAGVRVYDNPPGVDEALSMSEWVRAFDAVEAGEGGGAESILPFDQRDLQTQAEDAKAWGVVKRLQRLLGAGRGPRVAVRAFQGLLEATVSGEVVSAVPAANGAVLLDASASETVVRGVFGDRVTVRDVSVKDARDVSRRVVLLRGLSRGALGLTDWAARSPDGVLAFDKVAGQVADMKGRTVVFTYKALKDALAERVMELNPEWQGEVHHYGDVRGYNRWSDNAFVNFVTVGDPLPNPGYVNAVLRYLRVSGDGDVGFSKEAARGELVQAHGRARDPQAKTHARAHVHYGKLVPSGWGGGTVFGLG